MGFFSFLGSIFGGITSLLGSLFAPKPQPLPLPSPAPIPTPIPRESSPRVGAARTKNRQIAAAATGRSSTILTGGLLGPASTTKKLLLG